jgi:molybdopterin converting factor small subunit
VSDVRVRYWAAAKAAAGVAEEGFDAVGDLAALLEAIRRRHGAEGELSRVLARCSYLVDEVSPGRREPGEVALGASAVVDVLPPFAGGSGAGGSGAGGSGAGDPGGAPVAGTSVPVAPLGAA